MGIRCQNAAKSRGLIQACFHAGQLTPQFQKLRRPSQDDGQFAQRGHLDKVVISPSGNRIAHQGTFGRGKESDHRNARRVGRQLLQLTEAFLIVGGVRLAQTKNDHVTAAERMLTGEFFQPALHERKFVAQLARQDREKIRALVYK